MDLSALSQLTTIENGAFNGCELLEQVIFPNSITTIGDEAFYGCFSDKDNSTPGTVTLPSGLTSVGEKAFYDAKTLTTVNINCKLSAFGYDVFTVSTNNPSISYVNIPNFETNNESLGLLQKTGITKKSPAFIAGKLKGALSYPLDATTMTYDEKPVKGTSASSTVLNFNVPLSLDTNNDSVCEVVIPRGVTKIGKSAFSGCSSLNTIEILDSVVQIGESAFSDCTGLSNLSIPSTITSIGSSAFKNVPHVTYSGSASGSPWGASAVN